MIAEYVAGDIPDYQMAAFLMSVYFSGMDDAGIHSCLWNLRKITVKSKTLTKIEKNAFKGTNKKLTVKVPKQKKAKYKKLFKRKGNKKLRVK